MPKTYEKPFYKNIELVLWKKTARENTINSRYQAIMKIGYLTKAIAQVKAIVFAKLSVSVKKKLENMR